MSLTLLIVLITAIVAGVGFWFYNRRQINSLTETLEDKNAVINSFRDHLATPTESEVVIESVKNFDANDGWHGVTTVTSTPNPEKKKKRYSNRPKNNGNGNNNQPSTKSEQKQKEKSTHPKPEKIGGNKGRKPKKQQ
jgi:hypothetical protein